VLVGCCVGALLSVVNLYMALMTGWWDTGMITAAILGYVTLARWSRWRGVPYTPFENNITQTLAASVGSMPATLGLLGAIPGLSLMGTQLPLWAVTGFGLGLGGFGVALAVTLRRRLILEEKLPFPMGIAAAEIISAMHASVEGAAGRARALFVSAAAALGLTWLRDGRPAVISGATPKSAIIRLRL
jgi:uncharacterized oligopeptide transporter (OPT) family protein